MNTIQYRLAVAPCENVNNNDNNNGFLNPSSSHRDILGASGPCS